MAQFRFCILIVDDDPFLATTLASTLRRIVPPDVGIRVTHTLAEASAALRQHERFKAVVADHVLPDGRGADLLKTLALQRGRPLGLFLISGLDPDDIEVSTLLRAHPEITFIEKPFRFSEVAERIRHTVLPGTSSEGSFHGLTLFDLIQTYAVARKSATVRLLLDDGKLGAVFLRDGELVHAAADGHEGIEALTRLAESKRGEIRVERGCFTSRRSIEQPVQQALIEVVRRLDEQKGARKEKNPARGSDRDIDALFRDAFRAGQ